MDRIKQFQVSGFSFEAQAGDVGTPPSPLISGYLRLISGYQSNSGALLVTPQDVVVWRWPWSRVTG
jgi:hypothetical protein